MGAPELQVEAAFPNVREASRLGIRSSRVRATIFRARRAP
jgi:hypothetical protein